MNPWIKRLHLLVTIGGGFAGLIVTLNGLADGFGQSESTGVVLIVAALFCLFAIVLGIRLADGMASKRLLLVFYALQVPLLSSPLLAYRMSLGAHIYAGVFGGSAYLSAQLGDNYSITLGGGSAWGLGVNLFAVMMYLIARSSHAV